jgi:2-(1,2-epoxy-1,2-dihydrophenyl)acetyl-CoA isomerase
MRYETIELSVTDGVGVLLLNRPQVLNALNATMFTELLHALENLAQSRAVRALIISGAGRAFCTGADLGLDVVDLNSNAHTGALVTQRLREQVSPMVLALSRLPMPTISAVNGVAVGGGVGLALGCDIVIAARSAEFINTFVPKLGLIPDVGASWYLPRLIGPARARALTFLGLPLSAEQAASWGLIWQCVDDESLMSEAQALAMRLAAGPSLAYTAARELLASADRHELHEQLDLEAVMQGRMTATQDFREGVAAFRERRRPRFEGR